MANGYHMGQHRYRTFSPSHKVLLNGTAEMFNWPCYIYMCMLCAKSLQSCLTLCDPMTVACQAPLSMEFSRQEYWSELPCPPHYI